jgi:hypothetical protein
MHRSGRLTIVSTRPSPLGAAFDTRHASIRTVDHRLDDAIAAWGRIRYAACIDPGGRQQALQPEAPAA